MEPETLCPCCGEPQASCPCQLQDQVDEDGHRYAWCAIHQRIVSLDDTLPHD